jgi:hypothetical protein
MPAKLTAQAGDLFMACSDYPHSEGTTDPIAGYTGARCDPARDAGLFHDNVGLLLGRHAPVDGSTRSDAAADRCAAGR